MMFHFYKACRIMAVAIVGLFCCVPVMAQSTHTVKGKVVDENAASLPGASVFLVGSSIGTISDAEGNFTLTVPSANGQTVKVEVSFIGYQKFTASVVATAGQTTALEVVLPTDLLALDEVVVTGTSVATSRKQLGNAVATLSSKDFQNGTGTSIDQLLTGKVAGAQITQNSGNPAGGISIRLRGPSTIVGSSDPLYIVDGVIVNNSSPELVDLGGYAQNRLVDINPNDIERIEVIKGAAAAAIYGSRANNGVVQIFTKRGKEGQVQVDFSTQFRVNEIRKKLPYNKYPFTFVNTTASDLTQIPVERYDYQDKIFTKGIGTENYLSVSGGSATTQYFFSGSNFYNEGIIKGTNFSRNGVRLRVQQRFGSKATLSAGASYIFSTSNELPNGGMTDAYGALTGFIFSNNFINPEANPATGIFPSTTPIAVVRRTNPLEAIDRFEFKQRISRFIGDVQLQINLLEGLNLNYTLGFDTYTQLAQAYIPPGNTTPAYGQGFSRRGDLFNMQVNNDINITYQKEFTDWLESTTGIGGTIQYDQSYLMNITAQQLGTFGQTVNNGSNIVANEIRTERSIMGAFIQQTFGLYSKIFITGAARVDASSVYGIDNRWQFFPKVSGSYVLSQENFWKESIGSVASSFKIRAAWGQSGNLTAIGPYDRFTNYTSAPLGSLVGYSSPATLGNFTVKPERQTEFEVGFDLGLFKDRIGIEFSYYNKDVKDLILNRTLAPSTGYNNRFINVGTMTNKGFEVQIKATPVQKAVRWNSTFSYTHNDNVINGVEGNGVLAFTGGFGQVAAVNGYSLGAFYSTFFARNADGSLLLNAAGLPQRELGVQGPNGTYTPGRNGSGQPSGAVLSKVIGNPNPKHIVSWINDIDYKRFNFRMQWDGMLGFDVFNFTRRVGDRDLYGGLQGYEPELRGDVPKGTSAALFSIFENWIEDGSYVKLREISISYTVQPKIKGIKNMRVFVSGRNLLSIDDYSGYDPETNAAGQTNGVRGFDFVEVPIPRTYAVGVNLKF